MNGKVEGEHGNLVVNLLVFVVRIIAVNYPARTKGVSRHMRGDEAKKKCPEIVLVKVPCVRGKADLTK